MIRMPFDPDAPAHPDSGIFGLPTQKKDAKIVLIPVPFDATTSYGSGTSVGPSIIFRASAQVDLFDTRLGRIYEQGIHMLDEAEAIMEWSDEAGKLAASIGGEDQNAESDAQALADVEAIGEKVNRYVHAEARKLHAAGKVPGVVGGDHSVPLGAIRAAAEAHGEFGILHIDAHLDMRVAYEGFRYSHASIMFNVLSTIPQTAKIVSVGVRDVGEKEIEYARSLGGRASIFFDAAMQERLLEGARWSAIVAEIIAELPDKVYISFDIDGLDPSLCPHTGTAVPGGLSFAQAALLLEAVKKSGKKVIGFDLVEVSPNLYPESSEWDANVGARILYKLCGTV